MHLGKANGHVSCRAAQLPPNGLVTTLLGLAGVADVLLFAGAA
jgi:hypothetical protein